MGTWAGHRNFVQIVNNPTRIAQHFEMPHLLLAKIPPLQNSSFFYLQCVCLSSLNIFLVLRLSQKDRIFLVNFILTCKSKTIVVNSINYSLSPEHCTSLV
jgi:hypothetical protein